MRILTALSVAILASANAVAADQPAADADKAAIQALEDTYNEGFNSKDVDKVMSVYAPGKQLFVFDVVPPREYKGWEAYKKDFEGLFSGFPGPMKNIISEQTIHVVDRYLSQVERQVAHRRGTQFGARRSGHHEAGSFVQALADRRRAG
jgi:hypothetical protein